MDNNNNENNGYYESPTNHVNPYENQSQNQYGNTNQYGNQQMYNMNNTTGSAPDYMVWLILGIVQIMLICCCNLLSLVTGILTVVFAVSANNQYKVGNMIDYQSKMKTAKIINIVGWLLMVVNFIIGFFGGLFELILGEF